MRISPKLSEIAVWLLGNSDRNRGFPILNLPLDLQLEVRLRNFGCFWVSFSDKLYRKDGTTLGPIAGQLSSRSVTDDTLLYTHLKTENVTLRACQSIRPFVLNFWFPLDNLSYVASRMTTSHA